MSWYLKFRGQILGHTSFGSSRNTWHLWAPPGAGKTTLFLHLAPLRRYVIVFGTKARDPLYEKVLHNGYRRIQSIDEIRPWDEKLLLWPQILSKGMTIPKAINLQREVFKNALDQIMLQGGWAVNIDESKYCAEMLGLRKEITFAIEQLRSNNNTIICGAQRPSWIPPSVLAHSTHVFLWKTTDRNDQIKLADIGGIDAKIVRSQAMTLGAHEFIYIKTRGTESLMVRSEVGRR